MRRNSHSLGGFSLTTRPAGSIVAHSLPKAVPLAQQTGIAMRPTSCFFLALVLVLSLGAEGRPEFLTTTAPHCNSAGSPSAAVTGHEAVVATELLQAGNISSPDLRLTFRSRLIPLCGKQ
jgi:hypothetical protein